MISAREPPVPAINLWTMPVTLTSLTRYCPLLNPPGIMSYPAAPTLASLHIIIAPLSIHTAMDMTPRPLWPLPRWAVGHPHFDSQHIGAPLAPFPIAPQWHLILLPGSKCRLTGRQTHWVPHWQPFHVAPWWQLPHGPCGHCTLGLCLPTPSIQMPGLCPAPTPFVAPLADIHTPWEPPDCPPPPVVTSPLAPVAIALWML